jgi:YidC/Oxa1 family membrane protein insertase
MGALFKGNDGDLSHDASTKPDQRVNAFMTSAMAAALAFAPAVASAVAPDIYKVDKTGPIGFIATYIEIAIDAVQQALTDAGIPGAYGFGIIALTLVVKIVTSPLLSKQLETTSKMAKLKPIQDGIQKAYSQKESQEKNEMLARLFQTANVNPLAGCLPAFVQIPIFISLYRALQNLIAEDKLEEGFLWVPSLEGPITSGGGSEWLTSSFSGNPVWGYQGTLQYLSLAVILYVCQSASIKLNQPPRTNPDGPMTEAEQQSQLVGTVLPIVLCIFSLNVPAGLSIYWIANSILTTAFTLAIKEQFKNVELPEEVQRIQEIVDRKSGSMAKTVRLSGAYSSVSKTSSPSKEYKDADDYKTDKTKVKVKVPAASAADEKASEASFDEPIKAEMSTDSSTRKKKKKGKKNKKR